MGTNFTSLFAYYLASPANWLIALFPQRSMIEIMNAMIIVKLAAASVSFAYYIAKHFHTKKLFDCIIRNILCTLRLRCRIQLEYYVAGLRYFSTADYAGTGTSGQ